MAGAGRQIAAGFTMVEVLVAMALLALAALGVAELVAVGIRSAEAARTQTMAALLATQKMEQLLALTWRFDSAGLGLPESDTASDVSYDPIRSGGLGLSPSPAGTLEASMPGYADYVDAAGRWVGQGSTVPSAAVFLRRWRIVPLAADPANAHAIQVLVRAVGRSAPAASADAVLTSVRTRRTP